MSLFRGMDEMEESWQDVAPVRSAENVLDTGEKAYQRTQQLLAEAQVVGNILFDGGHRGSRSPELPRSPDERFYDTLEDPQTLTHDDDEPGAKANELSSFLFNDMLATVGAGGSTGGGLGQDAVDRRPEERSFCEAFLQLQEELRSLPEGARVQPRQIKPILNTMLEESKKAQATAAASMARLRELQGDGSRAVAAAAKTSHELSLEKDTWSLLLYLNAAEEEDEAISAEAEMEKDRDSYSASNASDPRAPAPAATAVAGGAHRNDSDDIVMESMWNRDWLYRRTHAVVRWLQHCADSQLESRAPAAFVTRGGKEVGWGRTLEALASGVGGHKNSEVAQMHPDANLDKTSSRGGGGGGRGSSGGGSGALKVLRLVGQDDLDEEEIVRTMWGLVRAGRVKAAKDLCVDRGQPWRAAALGGGGVVGGGVVGTSEDGDPLESAVVFAPGQGLWQEMCWQLSVSLERGVNDSEGPAKSVAQHEAAVFAHLAGNADLLLYSDLTQSWEDQAWVHFCSLLHRKILIARIQQRRVQASFSSLFPGVDTLPTDEQLLQRMERSSPPSSHEAVFEVLDGSSQPRVRDEGKGTYRQAQQALILAGENIPLFLEKSLLQDTDPSALDSAAASHDERQWGVAASSGGIFAGLPPPAPCPPSQRHSPQLLRFAAHFALVLAALCPYLTRSDGSQEAIEDVVCAYVEHLGKTQQISLIAVYAATLPLTRRRELYARILQGVEGEHGRNQALEQAKQHMSSDVPAILKKVVEHARVEIPSVEPRDVRQVPEGDLKKIQTLSWLLNEEDTKAEAVMQANSLARHFVLQQYQPSVIEGQSASHSANPPLGTTKSTTARNAGGTRSRRWNRPLPRRPAARDEESTDDATTRAAMEDCEETPLILSARIEAVEMLLKTAPIAAVGGGSDGGSTVEGKEDVDNDSMTGGKLVIEGVAADAVREQECWLLLVQARKAYMEWVSTRRAREQGEAGARGRRGGRKRVEDDNGWAMVNVNDVDSDDDGDAVAVRDAAEKAIAAAERVLMFEDGWMYPEEDGFSPTSSQATHTNPAAWPGRNATPHSGANMDANPGALVIAKPADGGVENGTTDASGNDAMIVEYPLAEERLDNKERLEEKRKEGEVAEARKARGRREIERAAREEEAAVRLGAEARRKELLAVREACLPGLVFLFHEVVHGTGLWMLKCSDAATARGWFVRGQTVANVVANDVHRLTEAMSKAQMCRLLHCVERSTAKVIECDERINNVEGF